MDFVESNPIHSNNSEDIDKGYVLGSDIINNDSEDENSRSNKATDSNNAGNDDQYRPMVYIESEYYHINLKNLFVEFFLQTLFPLSFFFTSHNGRKVRGFVLKLPKNFDYDTIKIFAYQLFFSYIIPCMHLFLFCYSLAIWDLTAFVALSLFYMHKLMIALKYSTLSPVEYDRMMNCENPEISQIYQNQLQLLTGWLLYNEDIINYDLNRAGDICGGNSELIFFCFPVKQIPVWTRWLNDNGFDADKAISIPNSSYDPSSFQNDNEVENGDTFALINVNVVSHALVKQCSNLFIYFKWSIYWNYLIVYSMIFRSLYLLNDDGDDGMRIFYKLIKNIVLWIYWPIIFSFIFLGVWDYLRRYHIAQKLNEMISIQGQTSNDTDIIKMDGLNQESKKLKEKVTTFLNRLRMGKTAGNSSGDVSDKGNQDTSYYGEVDDFTGITGIYEDASIYDDDDLPSDWIPNRSNNPRTDKEEQELLAAKQGFKYNASSEDKDDSKTEQANGFRIKIVKSLDIDHKVPSILLDRPMNATAWAYMRQVLVMMGGRYKYRLELFYAVALGLSLVVTLILLLQILVAGSIESNDINSKDYFFEIVLLISNILIYSFMVVLIGISVNWTYQVHRDSVTSNSMRNETKLSFLMRQAEKMQAIYKMRIMEEDSQRVKKEIDETGQTDVLTNHFDEEDAHVTGSLDESLLPENVQSGSNKNVSTVNLATSKSIALVLDDLDARMNRLRDAADYCNRVNYTLMIANDTSPLLLMGIKCDESFAFSIATGFITLVSTVISTVTSDNT